MSSPAPSPKFSISLAPVAAEVGLDARGLVPLALARQIVASASVFARDGDPTADVLWAALLSLEDGDEFSREASRLEWRFPFLRGWDNDDAVRRYGDGALPFLETLLARNGDAVGSGPSVPFYFVGTHLLAMGPAAVRAVLRARRDGDPDSDGLGFVNDWLAQHGHPAWVALGELALEGDAAAREALQAMSRRSAARVTRELGAELSATVLAVLEPVRPLDARRILDVLDAAASAQIGARLPWPTLVASAGHFEYHAMRVVAARDRGGDEWGILVEVVQGDEIGDPEDIRWPATIQRYTYGSGVQSGGAYLYDVRPVPEVLAEREVTPDDIGRLDLRPGRTITGPLASWSDVLALRLTVAVEPEILFPPGEEVVDGLGLPDPEVLLDIRELEHVSGVVYGAGELARLPSQSRAWRSIAEVVASRDPAAFDPGAVNTDWRQHAGRTDPHAPRR